MLVVLREHHYMYHYTYYGLSENVGVHLAHPHDRAILLTQRFKVISFIVYEVCIFSE